MSKMKYFVIIPLILFVAVWSCAGSGGGSSKALTAPIDESTYLVCGSVILENNWYVTGEGGMINEGRQVQDSYQKDLEIAILGKYRNEEGKEKSKIYYVQTDENGYFFIENVPAGEYALKGFRASLNDGRYITVFSDLEGAESSYLLRRRQEQMIVARGSYFPYPATNRIVNLRHTVFFMSNTPMVASQNFVVIRDLSFNFPSIKYTKEPVEEYLMRKFPDTAWKQYLMASAQENLQSGY